MERKRESQQRASATLINFRKEGADVNKHGKELFGMLKGIHDNQVVIMQSLAALWLRQANMDEKRKQQTQASGIVTPDFMRRG